MNVALILKGILGSFASALVWLVGQLFSEAVFRGVAIDMARWACRWLKKAIPGTEDDAVFERFIRRLDELDKAP